MLYAIVALLVIVLDQWTKLWVATNHDMLPRTLIEGVVTIVEAKNTGGAFSFLAGQNMTVFFIAAAGVMALVTIILLSTNLVKGGLGRGAWCSSRPAACPTRSTVSFPTAP